MADFNLEKFIDEIRDIAEIRNLDPFNPVVIYIQNPSSNLEFRVVAAMVEPSKYIVPVNGVWIMLDPKSSNYRKCFRMVNPNEAADGFNATWVEVFSKEAIFAQGQYFDVLRGQPGEKGDKGEDSTVPGPPGPQGVPGNAAGIVVATGIVLTSNSLIFKIDQDDLPTPSSISFLARLENLVGDPTFSILTGTAKLTAIGNTATLRYADMATDVVTVRASFTDDRGVTYFDDETVAKVREGSDAVTMLLTNETMALPADVDGVVTSYAGASTDVIIYFGASDVTAGWTLTKTDSAGITSTISGKTVTITNLQVDTGYVDITATRLGASPVKRRFSVTRVKTGADGAGSYELILNSDSQIFSVNNDDEAAPAKITFKPTLKNITGDVSFKIIDGTGKITDLGNTAELLYTDMETESVTVRASLTYKNVVYQDDETVAIVRAGSSAITALLTNETVTLPSKSDGTIVSLVGAETLMRIYVGDSEQTSDWTYTKVDSAGLTTALAANKVTVKTMTTDSGYSDITASRAGFPSVTKRFSISKSKAGADGGGANAYNVVLTSNSQMFVILKDQTHSPDVITFKATLQNIIGTVQWSISSGTAVITPAGSVATIAFADMASETVTVRVQIEDVMSGTVYTDEETIAKIREGEDSVTALLTNESVSLQADQDGVIENYDGAATDIVVFVGSQDDTDNWSIAKADSTGLTTTLSGKTIRVDSLTVDQAYCDVTVTKDGYSSVTKRFSIIRTKAGKDGNIKELIISASSQVFVTAKDGTTSPTQTVFKANLHALTGDPVFTVIDGEATITDLDNTATLLFEDMVTDSVTVRARLEVDGIVYQDDETVVKLRDGEDSVTAILTNETVTLAADNLGTVTSYIGAATKMIVYNGTLDTTTKWTFTKADSAGIKSTLLDNAVAVTNMTADTAWVDIMAKRDGYPSITKRFNLSKAKNGSDGSAEGLTLTADAQVFVVNSAGQSSKDTITFTSNLNNVLGTPDYTVVEGTGTVTAAADGLTATLKFSDMTSETLTVSASVLYNGLVYSDRYTVAKLHNGSDAITAILTNENIGLAANALGVVTSYAGATTRMVIYSGATDVTGQYVITKTDSAGVTSTLAGNLVTVTKLDVDSGYVDITATRDGASPITKRMTLAKTKAGADGQAQMVIINVSSMIFALDKDSIAAPSEVTFEAILQNILGVPTFTIIEGTATLSEQVGNKVVLKYENMISDSVTVRATVDFNGVTYQDDQTVAKLYSGVDALAALLTNETASVPSDVNGVVTSLDGVQTSIVVYNGSTDVTADYTVTKNDGPGITSLLENKVVRITTMSVDTSYVDISARRAADPLWIPAITKRFSVTKIKTGKPGVDGLSSNLSNETFTFNADFAGAVSNYTGATSTMKIINGVVDDSANWKVVKADSVGITSTLNDKTVTVTAITNSIDTGTVTLTATRTGFPTLTRVFSLSKTKAGKPGDPGAAGTSGVNGKRGSMTFYLSGNKVWSDSAATVAASVQAGPILNDVVIEYNTPTGFNEQRFWSGTAWVKVDQVIPGNLLVKGTVGADQLSANSIRAGSAVIEAGALGTLMLAGNSVTQVVAAIQSGTQTGLGYQTPIPPTGVWTEFLRYANLDLTGTQPIVVWGTCNTVAIHQRGPGEVAQPGQGEDTYGGVSWVYNLRTTWYGIRVSMINVVTRAEYHFICQDGVQADPAHTSPATINALFPILPAGRYNCIISGRIGAITLGGNLLEGIGIRSGQVAILETKR